MPILVLVISLAATVFLWLDTKKNLEEKQRSFYNSIYQRVESALVERMAAYIDAHYAGAGVFAASSRVTADEWRRFVRSVHLVDRYPGINGLGFTEQTERADKAKYEKQTRADGVSGFRIFPKGDRENYFAVKYIEPIELNRPAVGFDMGSEENRRKAMEEARDSGEPRISARIILVQDSARTPGFLSYVPFYEGESSPNTVEERREKFIGLIYAPFITKNLVKGIFKTELSELKGKISLEIFQGQSTDEADLMYRSSDIDKKNSARFIAQKSRVEFYGQVWTLVIAIDPNQFYISNQAQAMIILFAGLVLSLLLFLLFRSNINTKNEAIKLAQEMTHELNLKTKQLERSNENLNSFAYIASHDLKEPLRTIHSYVELIRVRLKKYNLLQDQDEDLQKYFDYALNATKRLADLIKDLLEFSRINNSEESNLKLVSLQEILEETLLQLEQKITETNTKVEIKQILPQVKVNPIEISRLFQNLISNAIKYKSPEVDPKIEIDFKETADEFVFEVKDNGIGIASEYHEQVFVLFKRLHRKEDYPGTGIGLGVCKKILENHGGKIWLESELGRGASFFFSLPKS